MTHVATAAILVGFAILAAGSGGQLDFAAWHAAAPRSAPLDRDVVLILVVVGFGTKAGAMPFHVWLPQGPPGRAVARLGGHVRGDDQDRDLRPDPAGLRRRWAAAPAGWASPILGIGAVSAVMGVLYALMQHDIKRLLAFHSIENIGIILIGLGSAILLQAHGATDLAALALAAAMFHSINHAVFKSLLFLGAGAVIHATGLPRPEPSRRPGPEDAGHDAGLRRRGRGDQRPAAAQRLRQRVADVPGLARRGGQR